MATYRGTFVLLILLLALGGFLYAYEFRGPGGEVKAKEQEAVVFALKEADIQTVQVRDGDKTVALAKDDADKWRLTGPTAGDAEEGVEHADLESPAGWHFGPAQDREAGGRCGGCRSRPAHDVSGAELRSPHRGRARGGAVPGADQRNDRRSRVTFAGMTVHHTQ